MNKPADPVKPEEPKGPWWRVGMMWLVVGGPLIVVLASLEGMKVAAGADAPCSERGKTLMG